MSATKKADAAEKRNRAVWLQLFIDEHYGVDIASYTKAEIDSLASKLIELSSLGVDTDDLKPADDYSAAEVKKAGYKR
jgi:hypothetical protein